MSKITFRADDELINRLESLDASKSEVMREALRAYLNGDPRTPSEGGVDEVIVERVDALVDERLGTGARDVNITIAVERDAAIDDSVAAPRTSPTTPSSDGRCRQCGDALSADHVYCPNCGEKRSKRVFCECGDEVRVDWSFCPSCGRRTPAADVLDRT